MRLPSRPTADRVRAVTIPHYGGPEVLTVGWVERPSLDDGHVLVAVGAAAVSNNDVLLRTGAQSRFLELLDPPYIAGMDLAGVVVESADPHWSPGDRVMGVVSAWRRGGGAQSSLVAVPAESLAPTPEALSDVEASTLPMNALTAWVALEGLGVGPGDTMIVLGAAGAVGGYAVQLASARGINVVAEGTSNDEELLTTLGADVVVPRGTRSFEGCPDGVDALLDTPVTGQDALALVRDGGRIATLRPIHLELERDVEQVKVFVPDHLKRSDALAQISRLAANGSLSARVAAVFAPERAADAHRAIEAGGIRGRPVLDLESLA